MVPSEDHMQAHGQNLDYGYSSFLAKHGLTDLHVQEIMSALPLPVPNKVSDAAFQKDKSKIHGIGMLASRKANRGDLFPCFFGLQRFNLARYVNHSDKPNAVMDVDGRGNGWMVLLADIDKGAEATMDYNDNFSKSTALILPC